MESCFLCPAPLAPACAVFILPPAFPDCGFVMLAKASVFASTHGSAIAGAKVAMGGGERIFDLFQVIEQVQTRGCKSACVIGRRLLALVRRQSTFCPF